MVEVGDNREVTGLCWKLSLLFMMFNRTWQCQMVQILPTEEVLTNQDWGRYSIN